jgi:hypothetical protein
MFTGAMVALVTPFHGGEVDFNTLDELVDFSIGQRHRRHRPRGHHRRMPHPQP